MMRGERPMPSKVEVSIGALEGLDIRWGTEGSVTWESFGLEEKREDIIW